MQILAQYENGTDTKVIRKLLGERLVSALLIVCYSFFLSFFTIALLCFRLVFADDGGLSGFVAQEISIYDMLMKHEHLAVPFEHFLGESATCP